MLFHCLHLLGVQDIEVINIKVYNCEIQICAITYAFNILVYFETGHIKSNGMASWKTAKPSHVSPVDSNFQGGILALLGSAASMASGLKGTTVSAWAHRDCQKTPASILPVSSSSAALFSF